MERGRGSTGAGGQLVEPSATDTCPRFNNWYSSNISSGKRFLPLGPVSFLSLSSFPRPCPVALPATPAQPSQKAFILKPAQSLRRPVFPRVCPQGLESLAYHMALCTPIWPGSFGLKIPHPWDLHFQDGDMEHGAHGTHQTNNIEWRVKRWFTT